MRSGLKNKNKSKEPVYLVHLVSQGEEVKIDTWRQFVIYGTPRLSLLAWKKSPPRRQTRTQTPAWE